MRVLFLQGRLSDRGGAERWLLGVLAQLQERAETLLGVGRVDPALPRRERQRVGRSVRLRGLDRTGLGRGRPAAAVAALERVLANVRPDVVHANDLVDPDLLAVVAGTDRGVMTVQDHRAFCPGRGKVDAAGRRCDVSLGEDCLRCFDDAAYGRTLLDLTRRRLAAVARMARVTVLSRYMAGELAAAGVAPDRIVHLPPFVDGLDAPAADGSALAGPARGPGTYHLFVGRLAAHKGVRVALAAASLTRAGLPLVVAGDGPLAGEVRQAAAAAPAAVRAVGWADRETLARLLDGARTVWLPSLWAEPFGIAGLEALARGVPVIAARGGGVGDWLDDGREGLLVPPGDAAALARAADRLAAEPALARALGRAGRDRAARDFAPGPLMDRLVAIYRDVTG